MTSTGNPRAPKGDTIDESTGPVASDSLAAESLRSGGDFADGNAEPLSVKGANSTLNTTDTSGATALPPAQDGTERARQEALGLGSDEKGTTGVKYDPQDAQFTGTHSQEGYVGGPSSDNTSGYQTGSGGTYSGATGDSFSDNTTLTGSSSGKDDNISSKGFSDQGSGATGSTNYSGQGSGATDSTNYSSGNSGSDSSGPSAGTGVRPATDTAPNYAGVVSGAIRSEGEGKPKGSNLTEGDIPETKTFTGNVGGQYDPGRAAESTFNKVNAEGTVASGESKYAGDGSQSTENKFDVLNTERAPDTSVPDQQ